MLLRQRRAQLVAIFALFLLFEYAGKETSPRSNVSGHATIFVRLVRLRHCPVLFNGRLGEYVLGCGALQDPLGGVAACV